jgi:tRNA 2-thiouridine synthesizing protein A
MSQEVDPHAMLDLRGVICPYNFVKTKLRLEAMQPGQVLEVFLDDGEPIRNVPQSVENEGHSILRRELVGSYHRVFIQKGDD